MTLTNSSDYPCFSFKKNYLEDLAEIPKRFDIFLNNMKEITQFHRKYPHTVFDISRFSDLPENELKSWLVPHYYFIKQDNNTRRTYIDYASIRVESKDLNIAPSFDWRTKNKVTRVKDQGQCGSCFAFAVAGAVESQIAIKENQLLDLSEQQILDCDMSNYGCNGGMEYETFEYVKETGLTLDSSYSYIAGTQSCQPFKHPLYKIRGYKHLPRDEEIMANWLVQNGPFTVGKYCVIIY